MEKAFSPIKIRNTEIKNRFIRSSTNEGKANQDGSPPPELLDMYVKYAEGDIGLIVTGFMYPNQSFKALDGQSGLYSNEIAEQWRSTVEKVHSLGSKIIVQLTHAGPGAHPDFEKVSATERGRPLTIPEIQDIISEFAKAAKRAEDVGFDGMQYSSAHGYLLSTFLSPLTNHRTDQYGGSDENRVRIIREITQAIRKVTKPDFIVGIKLNGDDSIEGGVTKEIAAHHVALLSDEIDFFEISCGLGTRQTTIKDMDKAEAKQNRPVRGEGYNMHLAEYIKKQNPNTLIAGVGGIRTRPYIEEIFNNDRADLVAMSRPFLEDPFYLNKLK